MGLMDVCLGEEKADIVIKCVNMMNVCSGEMYETDIAIYGKIIAGLGEYNGKREIDGSGKYAVPGLIDGHTHLEMSMISPSEFARIVIPRGTTTVIEDPHEIANVLGMEGIKMMIDEARTTRLKLFIMAPSCVPSTELETSGAEINAEDIGGMLRDREAIGLAEMMNFPGVIKEEESVWKKLDIARGFPIDGHAPMLRGKELNAYIAAGIGSDHESISLEEGLEKLRLGMRVMIREGSTAKNLKALAPIVKSGRNCILVTDGDRTPKDLMEEGHMDWVLRRAIEEGIDPITAVQMCTINPAEWFGLDDLGIISPGKTADIVLLNDLEKFEVERVIVDGEVLGEIRKRYTYPEYARRTMNLRPLRADDLKTKMKKKMRVIYVEGGEIITHEMIADVNDVGIEMDIIKIAVIERHKNSGNIGIGFVHGFGLKRGAIASSVAHDSHNVIVIGTNEDDMALAVNELSRIGGGFVIHENGNNHSLPLPIAGLMSDERIEEVLRKYERINTIASDIGCELPSPFISLSFLALPVIPDLKLTDKGLVDVNSVSIVDLWVE
jgi:adenine deaminase